MSHTKRHSVSFYVKHLHVIFLKHINCNSCMKHTIHIKTIIIVITVITTWFWCESNGYTSVGHRLLCYTQPKFFNFIAVSQ